MARPEKTKTPLAERLRSVRRALGDPHRAELALRLGFSEKTLGNYERGDSEPDASSLLAYQQVLGVNVRWVLTGSGDMFDDPQKAPAPATAVDPFLMEKLYKAVERVYRDAGQRPPGHRIANEAAELLNMLLEKVTDIRDEMIVDAVIPALAQKLFERLAKAAAEPGTGKRSAS